MSANDLSKLSSLSGLAAVSGLGAGACLESGSALGAAALGAVALSTAAAAGLSGKVRADASPAGEGGRSAPQITIRKKKAPKGEDGYKIVSVRMREELLAQLDQLADDTNRSRNELINLLLRSALEIVTVEE